MRSQYAQPPRIASTPYVWPQQKQEDTLLYSVAFAGTVTSGGISCRRGIGIQLDQALRHDPHAWSGSKV